MASTDDDLTAAQLDDPAEADATRAMINRVRALPREGNEPDWSALEQQIRTAVGPTVPAPWWRRARWLAPIGALATTAAIALIVVHHAPADRIGTATDGGASGPAVAVQRPLQPQPAVQATQATAPAQPAVETAMYIDGQVIDVAGVNPEALLDDPAAEDTAEEEDAPSAGILPAADLSWVDGLDAQAMERAEQWLARKKG